MALEYILGWNWHVRRLRRRWDRLREKSLKRSEPLKSQLLQKLDLIESNIKVLEEQKVGIMPRKRISDDVALQLSIVKVTLKQKEDEKWNGLEEKAKHGV